MSGKTGESSPLARLMLVLICLAITGSILAGIHYIAVDIPQQQAARDYAACNGRCVSTNVFISTPLGPVNPGDEACRQECRERYLGR